MTDSLIDSNLYGGLFSDPEIAALFRDRAEIRAMLRVEGALARVQGRLGVIPAEAAERIAHVADSVEIDPARLAEGTARAGVPVPALVDVLREAIGGEAAGYVHWGATSQDIVDTATVLRLRTALELCDVRLDGLIRDLAGLAEAHRGTLMAGRTRAQQALPTTFGLKVAGWLAPLVRHRRRLAELRPRLFVVQFGGGAGTLAALGDRGLEVMLALADELDLGQPVAPWHTQRDGLGECAGWLSLVTGALGKIGQDIVLMAQSEVGELVEGGEGRGGSSTLPQKANPVAGEVLVTVARINAGLLANMHQALIQEHERGGAGWLSEWLTLPRMAALTGCALRHAGDLAARLEVRGDRMRANLNAANGLVLAEAATFALARHMPRAEAQAAVKAACVKTGETGRHLVDILAETVDAPVDWRALRDPANYLGEAERLIDRVIESAGLSDGD